MVVQCNIHQEQVCNRRLPVQCQLWIIIPNEDSVVDDPLLKCTPYIVNRKHMVLICVDSTCLCSGRQVYFHPYNDSTHNPCFYQFTLPVFAWTAMHCHNISDILKNTLLFKEGRVFKDWMFSFGQKKPYPNLIDLSMINSNDFGTLTAVKLIHIIYMQSSLFAH